MKFLSAIIDDYANDKLVANDLYKERNRRMKAQGISWPRVSQTPADADGQDPTPTAVIPQPEPAQAARPKAKARCPPGSPPARVQKRRRDTWANESETVVPPEVAPPAPILVEESPEKKPAGRGKSALKQGQKKLRKQKEAGQGAGEVQPELLEQAVGV